MEALSGDMGLVFDAGFRMDMNTAPLNVASQSAVTPNAPLMGAAPVATAAAVSSGSSTGAIGEWKAWDDAAFDSMNFELDLGFDTFLMATADDFMQPHTAPQAAAAQTAMMATSPTSPPVFSDAVDSSSSCPSESECSVTDEDLAMMLSVVKAEPAPVAKRSRKRKNPETLAQKKQQTAKPTTSKIVQKKAKSTQQKSNAHATISADAERLFRRRYDILHEILEAWNTGGIEDMEEIADDVYDTDVTLVSPDYSEGLKGVQALMHHWTLLLDSFPDGIMEEYQITRDDPEGQKMNVSWVFSGTHIFPFFGVEPRHKKITLRGKSFFTFKGEKINQMVLSWNYRDALMQLMG